MLMLQPGSTNSAKSAGSLAANNLRQRKKGPESGVLIEQKNATFSTSKFSKVSYFFVLVSMQVIALFTAYDIWQNG